MIHLRCDEFKNDSMMRELHKLRRREYERFKDVPVQEALAIRRRELQEKLERDGWVLVDAGAGTRRLQKVQRRGSP